MGFNSAFKGLMYHNPALNKSNATNTQYRVSHFVRMQAGEWEKTRTCQYNMAVVWGTLGLRRCDNVVLYGVSERVECDKERKHIDAFF